MNISNFKHILHYALVETGGGYGSRHTSSVFDKKKTADNISKLVCKMAQLSLYFAENSTLLSTTKANLATSVNTTLSQNNLVQEVALFEAELSTQINHRATLHT